MDDCAIFDVILLDNIMNLHMSSLGTLVPEEHCCVCYTTRYQIYWGLTHNEISVNTENTDKNSVNKQNTHMHTKHSEKDNTGKV